MSATIPLPLGALIGREDDVREVGEVLAGRQVVTLVGPPGIGKTRLAVAVASAASGEFPDGTAYVELAKLSEPARVAQAFASAMGVREEPGLSLEDTLCAFLHGRRYLLVVDNCEHVLAATSALVEALTRRVPTLAVLATSREALAAPGEVEWSVPPLGAGDDGVLDDADTSTVPPAVQLFVERAKGVTPDFAPTPDDLRTIAHICQRLDGVALAIELAAARVDVLSPHDIAERLGQRLDLLTVGSRTASTRHQTLRDALEWSYGLLSDDEATLLRRLAVFAGGCSRASVAAVCSGDGLELTTLGHLMDHLVAKSLVVSDGAVEPRYCLLETIREYGLSKLGEHGETEAVDARHAAWCIRLAEDAEARLYGPARGETIEQFELEHDNVRAALGWSVSTGHDVEAMRLAAATALFWSTRGYLTEGRDWLWGISRRGAEPGSALRARVLWGAGFMFELTSDYGTARQILNESFATAREAGDPQASARSLMTLGICALFLLDQGAPAARALFEQSCTFARAAGDRWCLVCSMAGVAWVRNLEGDPAGAISMLEECIDIARAAQDGWAICTAVNLLGTVSLRQGDVATADALLSEAIGDARGLGDPRLLADVLQSLCRVAVAKGELDRAERAAVEALELGRAVGSRTEILNASCELGVIALERRDHDAANAWFTECLSIAWQMGGSCPVALLGLGRASLLAGDRWAAEALFERALAAGRAAAREIHEVIPEALAELGELARARGEIDRATELHQEALRVNCLGRDPIGTAKSLEAIATLSVEGGAYARAARLLAAADSIWTSTDFPRPNGDEAQGPPALASVRERLPAKDFDRAWRDGSRWSAEQAVSFARDESDDALQARTGWESLTRTEREVAALVAENLTNREIGDRLFISPRTVQTHLSHIYSKLGIASRRELAREITDGRLTANPLVPRSPS